MKRPNVGDILKLASGKKVLIRTIKSITLSSFQDAYTINNTWSFSERVPERRFSTVSGTTLLKHLLKDNIT